MRRGRLADARAERGSATLELAVLAPGLLLLVALLTFAGRHAMADGTVEQAAADAARAASLQRSATAGAAAAVTVARRSLSDQGLACSSTTVDVDTSGLSAAPGEAGRVIVTVSCPLKVADLPLMLPSVTVAATAVSPVDTYRE